MVEENKQKEKKEVKVNKDKISNEHFASLFVRNLPISTKQCVEICGFLRNKRLDKAKRMLDDVINKKRAVPFKRYNRDMGHKPGMAAGRFPVKASKEILRLLNSVEANADNKGLDVNNLVLFDIHASQGMNQWHYGRKRRIRMKRTHIIIKVKELEKW